MKKIPRYIENLKCDVIYEVGECAEENFDILDNLFNETVTKYLYLL
jgi:hypothetical protein